MSKPARTRLPFGGKRRLFNVIKVRLPNHTRPIEYDLGQHYLEGDCRVVVDTKRGPVLARTNGQRYRKVLPEGSLKPVLRLASKGDIKRQEDNRSFEKRATLAALNHIRALKLDMKLISVETLLDRSRTVFYFSADGRVDFRQLVRELSRELRVRVEMHQVGVRNGAGMTGGIGSCGRELCCSTFLADFEPVAIRMVKDQGLTLNPKKVSGMCGRLMCCLVYEHSAYVRGKKSMPRRNHRVITRHGPGKVVNTDIVSQTLSILHDDGVLQHFPIIEVVLDPDNYRAPPKIPVTIDGRVDDDDFSSFSDSRKEKPTRKRRNPDKRQASKGKSKQQTQAKNNKPKKQADSEDNSKPDGKDGSASPSRRSRRRRRRGGSGSKDGANASTTGAPEAKKSASSSPPKTTSEGGEAAPKKRRRRRRRKKTSGGDGNAKPTPSPGGGSGGGSKDGA